MNQGEHPNLTSEELVTLDMTATDRISAINELADLLFRAGKLTSKEDFVKDVLFRETQVPTSIGYGIAIPHSRSAAVLQTSVAIGRTAGFQWDASDDDSVSLVFLLAVPLANPSSEFIQLLASLARALLDEDFRKAISSATTKQEVAKEMLAYSISTQDLDKEVMS